MATEKDRHAETVIRNHAMWSIASGAIPLALADMAATSAVQLDMIRNLCEIYEVDFEVTKGKALVTSLTSAVLTRAAAASVVKMVPVAGSLLGSVTGGVLAGASSYSLGMTFKQHLAGGGTILDIDVESLKRAYREQFEKGKQVVREWQREAADEVKESRFRFEDLVRRKRPDGPSGAQRSESTTAEQDDTDYAEILDDEPGAATAGARGTGAKAPGAAGSHSPRDGDLAAKLAELTSLRERGLISEGDFESTKARLLGSL